jgi:DNA primase
MNGQMSNSELSEILDSVDMESWLDSEGIRYRQTRGSRGAQLNVKECPKCGNSNWKVYLNRDSGLGNCFSGDCETKYNKWSFIRACLGASSNREVIEHIKMTAREQGWRPPRMLAAAVNIDTELKLPESVSIPIEGRNLKYLENRNIVIEMANYFGLRYSANGVFKYQEGGVSRVQSYSKRIIIPVFDLDGDLVSFQGRDITGLAEKKYLFPPGFASSGTHLYNGQNAHGASSVVIGEGVFDVMATKVALDGQMELRNVVPIGTFGKHLSHGDNDSQLAKLVTLQAGGLKTITIMWDGESKALDAAIETGLLLRKYGFIARIAILPKDKDPNEVPASVVRNAYWKADVVSESIAVKIRLSKRLA